MELGILNNHGRNIHYQILCEQDGIEGKFTNHSLRASGATTLFQYNAPAKIIQEFTGHRSVKALRQYKKVASKHKRKLPVIF